MAPIPVGVQPAPSAGSDAGTPITFVGGLDTYVEHSMCSASAGDDNPY